jgi:hypothetical protein
MSTEMGFRGTSHNTSVAGMTSNMGSNLAAAGLSTG